jgi:hypothetical protein
MYSDFEGKRETETGHIQKELSVKKFQDMMLNNVTFSTSMDH